MAQLVRMDARLNTLSDELCQVNTRVGRIARRQAAMGGFIAYTSPSPSPSTSEDESDDDFSSDAADDDDNASSPNDDEMST